MCWLYAGSGSLIALIVPTDLSDIKHKTVTETSYFCVSKKRLHGLLLRVHLNRWSLISTVVFVGGKPGNFLLTGSDLPTHCFVWKLRGRGGNGEGREREGWGRRLPYSPPLASASNTDADENICWLTNFQTGRNPEHRVLMQFGFFTFAGLVRFKFCTFLAYQFYFCSVLSKMWVPVQSSSAIDKAPGKRHTCPEILL